MATTFSASVSMQALTQNSQENEEAIEQLSSKVSERRGYKKTGPSSWFCCFLFRSSEPAKGSRLKAALSKSWSGRGNNIQVDSLDEEDVRYEMKQIPNAFPPPSSPPHHPIPTPRGSIGNLHKVSQR